jgi:hypothetical protein
MPDLGSGYGGKHTGECAIEAARMARGAGRPVKLVWTREEEFAWGYFRPAGVMDISGAIDTHGKLTTWIHHMYNAGRAGVDTPYDVATKTCEAHDSASPLRQGSYRGLAGPANFFGRESMAIRGCRACCGRRRRSSDGTGRRRRTMGTASRAGLRRAVGWRPARRSPSIRTIGS